MKLELLFCLFTHQGFKCTQTKVRFSEELEPFEMAIVSDETKVRFEYMGVSDFVESKRSKAITAIKETLADEKMLNQKDILAMLEESGNKINAKTLR
jgi:hypothetical protein